MMSTRKEEGLLTWTYCHKKQIIFFSFILVLSVVFSFLVYRHCFQKKPSHKKDSVILVGKKEDMMQEKEETEEEVYYQVDIKGQVNAPGIYSVKKDSRVIDVIRLAGDLTEIADTSVLNLSKKVVDEMVIVVYSRSEVEQFTVTKEKEKQQQQACLQPSEESIQNDACISEKEQASSTKISLNNATKEELMRLTGIGEAKALAIIAYRQEHGPFQSVEEVKNVSGIGDELFAKIQEDITL